MAFTLNFDEMFAGASSPASSAGDADFPLPTSAVRSLPPAADDEFEFTERPVYRSLCVAAPSAHGTLPLPAAYAPAKTPSTVTASPALPPQAPIFLESTHVKVLPGTTPHRAMTAVASALTAAEYPVDVDASPFAARLSACVDNALVNVQASLFVEASADASAPRTLVFEMQRRSGCRAGFRRVWHDVLTALSTAGIVAPVKAAAAPRRMEPLPVPAHLAAACTTSPQDAAVAQLRSGFVSMQREAASTLAKSPPASPPVFDAVVDALASCADPVLKCSLAAAASLAITGASCDVSRPAATASALVHVVATGQPTADSLQARRLAARALAFMAANPAFVPALSKAVAPASADMQRVCKSCTDDVFLRDVHTTLRAASVF